MLALTVGCMVDNNDSSVTSVDDLPKPEGTQIQMSGSLTPISLMLAIILLTIVLMLVL